MDQQYRIVTSGVDGRFAATLFYGNEQVGEPFPVRDAKQAEKVGTARALAHKAERTPARVERHEVSFSL